MMDLRRARCVVAVPTVPDVVEFPLDEGLNFWRGLGEDVLNDLAGKVKISYSWPFFDQLFLGISVWTVGKLTASSEGILSLDDEILVRWHSIRSTKIGQY